MSTINHEIKGPNQPSSVKIAVQSACIIIAILIGIYLIIKTSAFLIVILVAVVISTGIDPSVTKLTGKLKKNGKPYIPREIATITVMLLCLLVIGFFLSVIISVVTVEINNFLNDSAMQTKMLNWLTNFINNSKFLPSADDLFEQLHTYTINLWDNLFKQGPAIYEQAKMLINKLSTVIYMIACVILIAFFTIFKTSILETLIRFIPPAYRRNTIISVNHAAKAMGGWLRGQILLALIVVVLVAAAMYAFQVPYAMIIAIFGGICELIPMIGPYAAFWPALIILLLSDWQLWQLIATIIFFLVLSQVENYYFTPKVMERQVGLHPITTIIALYIGAKLFGVIGALTAIPVAAALRIFIVEVIFPMIEGKKFTELYRDRKKTEESDNKSETPLERIKDFIKPEKPFEEPHPEKRISEAVLQEEDNEHS